MSSPLQSTAAANINPPPVIIPLPSPTGHVLSLVAALSSPENHELHLQAIQARDQALSASTDSYASLCFQLCVVLFGSDQPEQMLQQMSPEDRAVWMSEPYSQRLALQPSQWVVFGQTAGLVLKNALLRPPVISATYDNQNQHPSRVLHLQAQHAEVMQKALLQALMCQQAPLRAVASSIIASAAVSTDSVQPILHIASWPTLMPTLLQFLNRAMRMDHAVGMEAAAAEGSLITIRKMMEDGPTEIPAADLDQLVPLLVQMLPSSSPDVTAATADNHLMLQNQKNDTYIIGALQSLQACLFDGMMPSALVANWDRYLAGLSHLAGASSPQHASPVIQQWVCRTMVTLLAQRTEYLQPHFSAVAQFMVQRTVLAQVNNNGNDSGDSELVALEACEFWLTFCHLDDEVITPEMMETVRVLLPTLLPSLLRNMRYGKEQAADLLVQHELDMQQPELHYQPPQQLSLQGINMRPLFHKSRSQQSKHQSGHQDERHGPSSADSEDMGDDEDDDEDYGDFEDEEDGNEWTLRKCAAASLDSLANTMGAEVLLPCLLPSLQEGLSCKDGWEQEASILALGAIAEGCHEEMEPHMEQLHPFLMNILADPEDPNVVPQAKSTAAWTIGRYAGWAVEQVQTGRNGRLLARMVEVFLMRLHDRNRKVQVASCSAFGVVIESAGDLMAPYLEHMYNRLTWALTRYQGRSLLVLFDLFAIIADYCGPAIAEGNLPSIYVPPLLQMWDGVARHDPANRMLLPLMESLASIALTSGMNYQPYALQTFENAMCIIELVTLHFATSGEQSVSEEDFDPIICATDLLDGLVEGMRSDFQALVNSSERYGQHFLSFLHSLCRLQIPAVRTSALALLGDLARNAPAILEPALTQLLTEAVANMDPMHPSVCANAVWSIGEICVRCQGNPSLVEPFAQTMIQNLLAILSGNGLGGEYGCASPGLAENAAACLGRLALVDPALVASDFPRLLLGWCACLAKIVDPTERRDAFQGFVKTVYANPAAIQQAASNVADAVASIIFCIVSWHMPPELPEQSTSVLYLDYCFRPFPQHEEELGKALAQLMRDTKSAVGEDTWVTVRNSLPVNVRRLLRETYQL